MLLLRAADKVGVSWEVRETVEGFFASLCWQLLLEESFNTTANFTNV